MVRVRLIGAEREREAGRETLIRIERQTVVEPYTLNPHARDTPLRLPNSPAFQGSGLTQFS